jgi:hypothetical protein
LERFISRRINEAGAYSEFNPFRRALENGEKLVQKYKNSGLSITDSEIVDIGRILEKLDSVSRITRSTSQSQTKLTLKNLLRQKWFKDRLKSLLSALKTLVPGDKGSSGACVTTRETSTTNGEELSPGSNPEKETSLALAQTTGENAAQRGNAQAPDIYEAKNKSNGLPREITIVEEVFSEIIEILERKLGTDHDELEAIAIEVESVLYKWWGSNATQSLS